MKHFLLFSVASMLTMGAVGNTHDHVEPTTRTQPSQAFVENLGQWPDAVKYQVSVRGAALFLEEGGWVWSKLEESASDRMHDIALLSPEEQDQLRFNGHAWRMRFVNGAGTTELKGKEKAAHYHSYFLGNDPAKWAGHVNVFGRVVQEAVWPGIDVVMTTVDGNFKYDLVLAPGADPGDVAMAYEGLDKMSLGKHNELILGTSVGDVMEMAPIAFYGDELGGPIACNFVLDGSTVRFTFPKGYDKSRPVVIDPVLVAGTYSGATGASNYGHCAAFDDAGNIYTAGRNFGPTYPTTVGAFQTAQGGGGTDISLSKYNPDGSELIWASYLGGSAGENPHSLIANSLGELIVLASSSSADFPITAGAFDATIAGQDIAVVHIAADASYLIGSTFIGGSGSDGTNQIGANYGEAYRGEVFTDALGNILITSFSSSADFPVTAGAWQTTLGGGQDGVVVKLNPDCSQVLAATFIGGTSGDNAMGIRIADNGDLFVTGITESTNMPMPAGGYASSFIGGSQDAYVIRFNSDLTEAIAGTFFGTTANDRSYFIDVDSEDNVWIYGQTTGSVPISPAGTYGATGGNIFIAKILGDMTDAPVTTMIPGNTVPVAFLVDVCDHVYISGYNTGGNMPTTPDALYTSGSFYLASFDVEMTDILFGTHYGGSHVDGGTSRFDKNGIVYQGVCSGGQSMQSTPWAYATTNQISWDIAVFKIDFETAGVQANITSTGITGCVPATFTLNAVGQAVEFIWDLGDGSPLQTGTQITVTYSEIGTHVITLIGSDPDACNLADTTYITLNVYDPAALLADFVATPLSTCDGYLLQLANNSVGATQYMWNFGDGSTAVGTAPSHAYSGPGTYDVSLVALNTICVDTAETTIPVTFVVPSIPLDLPSPVPICDEGTALLNAGVGYDTYLWSNGSNNPLITVSEPGQYVVTVTDGSCVASDSITVILAPPPPPSPDVVKCYEQPVSLTPEFQVSSILWSTGGTDPAITVNSGGTYTFTAVDQYGCNVDGEILVVELPQERPSNFIPNVFTPNGDQKNDRFEVVADGLQQFRMEIYDRWGMKMYETNNQFNGWNGGLDNASSSGVPDGTYYYIIDFRDLCSNEPFTTKTGHVTLLR